MWIAWLNLIVMCLPACCGAGPAKVSRDDGTAQVRTLVVRTADDPQTAEDVPAVTPSRRSHAQHFLTLVSEDEAPPNVWIGVRLTPVPAPLAAHLGEHGVMISNVVKDSPADQADLEQYDVIVGYNGKDVNRPQDLTAAVAKTAPGQTVKLMIVRKGKPQEVEIKPAERPADAKWELKYEEPEDSAVDAAVKMYGRALQRGPNGGWIMKDLGPLTGVPDVLKELEDLDIDVKLDKLGEELGKLGGRDLDVRILRELKDEGLGSADEDRNVKVEVKIQIDEDGQQTMIEADPDGKIHVTHVDASGKETSATYDNREALEKADPEAYKLYNRYTVHRRPFYLHLRPALDRIRELRREYQIDVEKKMTEALEHAKKARRQAGAQRDEALKDFKERLGQTRVEVRARQGQSPVVETEMLMLRVNDDGTIKVVVGKNGDKVTHEFKSKEAFKAAEPELYERVKSLLE